MVWLAALAAVLAVAGALVAVAGWWAVRGFCREPPASAPESWPPLTVLKPLHDDEPLLEEALESFFTQDYPAYQLVFGLQSPDDPALAVVERLRRRFPERDVAVVVDTTEHGRNRKVANLINMLPRARHDLLVSADADLHAEPDYLRKVAAALVEPETGLATTLYTGRAGADTLAGRLGATAITHSFLPLALLGRALGREDGFGATLAVNRSTLEAIGGMASLSEELAEDAILARRVRKLGLRVRLAPTFPATTVPETRLAALLSHELRWARTIRALEPAGFFGSALQYRLGWAALAVLLTGGAPWTLALFGALWAVTAAASIGVDRVLRVRSATPASVWLVPVRDILSFGVFVAAFMGREVRWRGEVLRAERRTAGS